MRDQAVRRRRRDLERTGIAMTQSSPAPASHEWHKQVAMQCNNRAWALSVQTRSAAQDREMLDAAHASAYHWAQVGTELHRMRAGMLLAEVHALLGHGATALALATDMREYFVARGDTPDWELAFTHAIYAHAASAAGMHEQHRDAYRQAVVALAAIEDEEDRSIVAKTFEQVPAP
jgi:hypothetical protein